MRTERAKLVDTLNMLAHALTGKTPRNPPITEHIIDEVLEGHEFYLPDGGYSRIVVSAFTGNAFLTSNSREAVKQAWPHCKELIADLEQHVEVLRDL